MRKSVAMAGSRTTVLTASSFITAKVQAPANFFVFQFLIWVRWVECVRDAHLYEMLRHTESEVWKGKKGTEEVRTWTMNIDPTRMTWDHQTILFQFNCFSTRWLAQELQNSHSERFLLFFSFGNGRALNYFDNLTEQYGTFHRDLIAYKLIAERDDENGNEKSGNEYSNRTTAKRATEHIKKQWKMTTHQTGTGTSIRNINEWIEWWLTIYTSTTTDDNDSHAQNECNQFLLIIRFVRASNGTRRKKSSKLWFPNGWKIAQLSPAKWTNGRRRLCAYPLRVIVDMTFVSAVQRPSMR